MFPFPNTLKPLFYNQINTSHCKKKKKKNIYKKS